MNEEIILKFNEGLLPAIVQDEATGQVLMLAYMNKEAYEKTIETKTTWFYSRSRKKLWNKGETSGNFQKVVSLSYDCDGDAILVKVKPKGPACHTGRTSCFFNSVIDGGQSWDAVDELYETIVDRRDNPEEGSYTNYLFDKGIDKMLKKVGEEASEVIIASKNPSHEELIYEIEDLVYHVLVLMVQRNLSVDDIRQELKGRRGLPRRKR